MKKKPGMIRKSAAGLLLAGSLMFQTGAAWAALPPAADSLTALADSLGKDMGSLLSDEELLPAGDSVSDWIAFLTGRTGNKEMGAAYLNRLEEYVTKQYKEQGGLDPFTATSWHRMILTVAALGGEPTAFGEDADGNPVNLVADGCYNFHMTDSFDAQGMNAWLYALIALDSSDYKVPEGAKYTREAILEHIVSMQEEDGGFGLMKGGSDVDITAMVLQALAPYQHNTVQYLDRDTFPVRISDVTDKALSYLSSMQQKDGGYKSSDVSNSESCSQVIIALCSLGIDPETDSRFIKESHSVVDALDAFRLDDGSYSHDDAMISDGMATQQAAFAGFSLEQFRSGERRIFDLTDRPLDQAISLEAELSAMSEEEIKEKAEDLLKEYESVTPEDRCYVYSFSKVIHALEEKGIAFDEETSLYYELNDKTPTAYAAAGKSHSDQKSNAILYAGIGILVIGIAGGT
ncbi:MAG: terpene cyclase/mutase family protein, partial [Lachnospiraceae bacterium]|nr:terpene cyclase/mutase family protein [Lachnospiraceae bacterium]